jgi:hypothetical protein
MSVIDNEEIRSPIPNIGRLKEMERIVYNADNIQDSIAAKLGFIAKNFGMSHVRYVKADGNCFYRAFMFAYIEKVIVKGYQALEDFLRL